MELLLFFLISLTFFFLGRYSLSDIDTRKAQEIIKKAKKVDVGPIKRPTQEDLDAKTPQGKKRKEEEKAMEETLENLV